MVGSPVRSTLIKSAPTWTPACPGASIAANGHVDAFGLRQRDLRDLRPEQRVQDEEQGRSVFEHLIEDLNSPAPATAQMRATVTGGVSGPYPWRRPV